MLETPKLVNINKSNFGYFDDSSQWVVFGKNPLDLHLIIDCHEDVMRKKVEVSNASIYVITLYNFSKLEIPTNYYRVINNLEIKDHALYLPSKENPILRVNFEKIQIAYHGSLELTEVENGYDFYIPSKLNINILGTKLIDTEEIVLKLIDTEEIVLKLRSDEIN